MKDNNKKVEIRIIVGGEEPIIYRCMIDRVSQFIARDEVPNLLKEIASQISLEHQTQD